MSGELGIKKLPPALPLLAPVPVTPSAEASAEPGSSITGIQAALY